MDVLIANLQENAVLYALIMHVVMWLLVAVTRWFKESSSMRALDKDGIPEDAPEWGTPLVEFWDTTAYDPNWVWKAELVCLVLVLAAMWRYRPMKIQRKPQRGTQEYGKSSARSASGSYKAGARAKGAKSPRGGRGR